MSKQKNFVCIRCDDALMESIRCLASSMDWTISHSARYLIECGLKYLSEPDFKELLE